MNDEEVKEAENTEADPGPVPEAPPEEEIMFPVCPYCGTTPFTPVVMPFRSAPTPISGQIKMLVITCAMEKCRKVITIIPLPEDQPRIQMPGAAGPRSVRMQ